MDVALVTASAIPGLWTDDQHLLRALLECGVDAGPVIWEDPHEDWSAHRLCVVRSCWDYSFRRDAFVAWADRVAAVTTLWNSAEAVSWNTHKSYLRNLRQRGVTVVPTVFLERGTDGKLDHILEENAWTDVVIKPAVGASGRYAMRLADQPVAAGQVHLDKLLPFEDMLVQPFVPAVSDRGELSVIWIDGEISHAVRKTAPHHDFRVHADFGGSVESIAPRPEEFALAKEVLSAVEAFGSHYGRVDLVDDERGGAMVMELELVEPELFFGYCAESLTRFTEMIGTHLNSI